MWLAIRLGALVHLVAAAEAFKLAVAKGVSTELIYSLISGAAGSSDQFNQKFPKMMNRDFSVTSDINSTFPNVMKDLVRAQLWKFRLTGN
jgi:3-hydroxyisobutyrate dehydrogenase-like beta-hydroxyacid dehydrogenase